MDPEVLRLVAASVFNYSIYIYVNGNFMGSMSQQTWGSEFDSTRKELELSPPEPTPDAEVEDGWI